MMQNQLKLMLLAGVATLNMAAPAFAAGSADMAHVCPDGAGVGPARLSLAEMEATEGAQGPLGAVVGGALGGGAYAIEHAYTQNLNLGHLAANVATGAAVGAVVPPAANAARFVWAVNSAMARGVAQGTYHAHEQNVENRRANQ